MALTGLARKVLTRASLLAGAERDSTAATTDFGPAD
jgi:hypothetical protein